MANIVYDKYYGVDFTIDLYLELVKLWKNKKPGISVNPLSFALNPIIVTRLILSSIQAQIARTNELSLDIENLEKNKKIQETIDRSLEESKLIKKVQPKVEELTPKEIKQQLKNAISHAEYNLVTDEEGNTLVEIDSPKITATYTIDEMIGIASIYSSAYALLDQKETCYDPTDLLLLKTNNKAALEKAIENIRYGKQLLNVRIPSYLTVLGPAIDGERKELTKEQQQLVRDYILYGGLQNFVQYTDSEKGKIISDRILRIIEKRPHYRSTTNELEYTLDFLLFHGKGNATAKDFERLSFEAPSLYTSTLIDLGFLCLNHIKEAQAKQKLENFNYHNINLKGVTYWPKETVRLVSKEAKQDKLNNQIADLKPKQEKCKEQLQKTKTQIDKLEENSSMPPKIKKEQLAKKKELLTSQKQAYDDVTNRITTLQALHDSAEDYVEANDFFKHLRNSISHGFYSIDYSKGLSSKDLGKIIFHFEDWEIDKNDRTKRTKVFEADISAAKLTNIFEQLRNRIIENADSMYQQENKDFIIVDERENPKKDNEYVKRVTVQIASRGGNIIGLKKES